MTPTPLPLTVRAQDDFTQQQHMHRVSALAKSLHDSQTVPYVAPHRAPLAVALRELTGVGYVPKPPQPKAPSELASKLAEYRTRYYKLARARSVGSAASISKISAEIDRLEAEIHRMTEGTDARPSAPAGRPNLYAVTVPALEVTGYLPATYAAERWVLDTHTLPGELRERLGAYLMGGREALPFKHKRTRGRYWLNSDAREEDRALMVSLWGYAQPSRVFPPDVPHQAVPEMA